MSRQKEWVKEGKRLRKELDRKSQRQYRADPARPSVLEMIRLSNQDRLAELIPIRHARMSSSPFTFYRGTAGLMAWDLSRLPKTPMVVQAMGDCHLMNFGGFATPERTLVFDLNDFDETLPGPWEWDLKRLATSFVLAGRNRSLKEYQARELAYLTTQSYREHVARFAEMPFLDLWYMKFEIQAIRDKASNREVRLVMEDVILKSEKSNSQTELYKITEAEEGKFVITDKPPLIYHMKGGETEPDFMLEFMREYVESLLPDRQLLLSKYTLVDAALKVVGIGSVGTRCYVLLLMNERSEPLFLQVKEARASVLEPYTAPSVYAHAGQRVVAGQRLVQAASDILLGWGTSPSGRQYYVRQLRDRKIAPDIDQFDFILLKAYAKLCGRMLARAHAKTGNATMLASYMGKSDLLEESISRFAVSYADQTEKDFEEFKRAIKAGQLPANS